MENDLTLYSSNAIRTMEIIDITTGTKLGYTNEFKIDVAEQKVVSILIPSPNKSWFGKEDDIEIPWDKVVKVGVDVLLVDGSDIQINVDENKI